MSDRIEPVKQGVVPEVGNAQQLYRFPNGYGASVIRGPYTYGGAEGLYELAVGLITGPGDDDWEITYDTPVADDVLGWLTDDDVQQKLAEIQALPAVTA